MSLIAGVEVDQQHVDELGRITERLIGLLPFVRQLCADAIGAVAEIEARYVANPDLTAEAEESFEQVSGCRRAFEILSALHDATDWDAQLCTNPVYAAAREKAREGERPRLVPPPLPTVVIGHSCSITENVTVRRITYGVTCSTCGRLDSHVLYYLRDATDLANAHEEATA